MKTNFLQFGANLVSDFGMILYLKHMYVHYDNFKNVTTCTGCVASYALLHTFRALLYFQMALVRFISMYR